MAKIKIYLDAKDLIDLFEKSYPFNPDEFEKELSINNAELVLSQSNVFEIYAPLLYASSQSNIMKSLIGIEKMPIRFISVAKIEMLELKEALQAFYEGREYQQIYPFVSRFDETLSGDGSPPTKYYLNYGLTKTVFDLWTTDPNVFRILREHASRLRKAFEIDRNLSNMPALREIFVQRIDRSLKSNKLEIPSQKLKLFAEWIYKNPKRCPSLRISFEVYHKMLKNKKYIPEDSVISDFSHIDCIPYVDFLTFDRTMCSYILQACYSESLGFENRICKNLSELLAVIKNN